MLRQDDEGTWMGGNGEGMDGDRKGTWRGWMVMVRDGKGHGGEGQ